MNKTYISQLAETAEISTSAVRYYERIGLVPEPKRSDSGYRLYSSQAKERLLFIVQGKRLGLALDQIAELLAIKDGKHCPEAKTALLELLDEKQKVIDRQITELKSFSKQLNKIRYDMESNSSLNICGSDLKYCAPSVESRVELTTLKIVREPEQD